MYTVLTNIVASSSNGRTADSGSVNRDSNRVKQTTKKQEHVHRVPVFLLPHFIL